LLHDSNYDWGQGVPELREWNDAHNGGQPLCVWYFGTDPDVSHPPLQALPLSWHPIRNGDEARTQCPSKYLAVAAAVLSNNPAPTPMHKVSLDWVRARPVVARTRYFTIIRAHD
jgi:hypothetical protein